MGLIEAAVNVVGDGRPSAQLGYLTVPANIKPTAALFPAVWAGQEIDRNLNFGRSLPGVLNGTKIVVPEGYGLLLSEDGRLTSFVDLPGSYVWYESVTETQNYIFEGKLNSSPVRHSWEYFHSDSRPGGQQLATFVRLKELPLNRFGTQSTIYWDDAFLNTQVGAIAHGAYSLEIVDPIRFAMQFVPASFMQNRLVFDFTDWDNSAANQMYYEVVGSLASALSRYVNEYSRENRMARIQQDSVGFAASLSAVVEENYSWKQSRGVAIAKVAIIGIEYDEHTRQLLGEAQRIDVVARSQGSLMKPAPKSGFAQSSSEIGGSRNGIGELDGKAGPGASGQVSDDGNDLVATLQKLSRALEAGLISESEFDAARLKAIGI